MQTLMIFWLDCDAIRAKIAPTRGLRQFVLYTTHKLNRMKGIN
jgi:hypothetical protein